MLMIIANSTGGSFDRAAIADMLYASFPLSMNFTSDWCFKETTSYLRFSRAGKETRARQLAF